MRKFIIVQTVIGLTIMFMGVVGLLINTAAAQHSSKTDDLRYCSGHNICQGDIYCPGQQVPIVFGRWRGDGKIVPNSSDNYWSRWNNNTIKTRSLLAEYDPDHNYWWTVNAYDPPDPTYWLDVDMSTDAVCYQP